jgi:hypothetical protein
MRETRKMHWQDASARCIGKTHLKNVFEKRERRPSGRLSRLGRMDVRGVARRAGCGADMMIHGHA